MNNKVCHVRTYPGSPGAEATAMLRMSPVEGQHPCSIWFVPSPVASGDGSFLPFEVLPCGTVGAVVLWEGQLGASQESI